MEQENDILLQIDETLSNEAFDTHHSDALSKDVAILRYLCGFFALNSYFKVEHYNEDDLGFWLDSTFEAYFIKVENCKVVLINIPNAEHDLEASAEFDYASSDIMKEVQEAIAKTEKELGPQILELYNQGEELSLMERDIVSIHN